MTRAILLATAFLLAAPAFPHHAAAMDPACDQINDPATRSACHGYGLSQRQADTARQYQALVPRPVPGRRPRPAVRQRDPEMYATLLRIRREDCWARAVYQVGLVTDAQGPRKITGMRQDAALACLKATAGLAENLATIIDPNGTDGNVMLECVDDLKARHANDDEPLMLILAIKSCVTN